MEEENLYPTDKEMHNNANLMAALVDNMTEEELINFISYLDE